MIDSCQNTVVYIAACSMWDCVAADQSVTMLTTVHHWKRLQWALECQNWITEQWKKLALTLTLSEAECVYASFTYRRDGTRMQYKKKPLDVLLESLAFM